MKIYLAGKIKPDDWRTELCGETSVQREAMESHGFGEKSINFWGKAPTSHTCTGPFFLPYCHGTNHGNSSHGVGANNTGCCNQLDNNQTVSLCLDGIRRADIMFVWLDGYAFEAYGTIFEMGYAKAIGTPLWVAGDRPNKDQWFPLTASDRTLWDARNPIDALRWYLDSSSALPQSCDIYMKQAANDPEVEKARRLFVEFGPPGVRVPIPKHIRSAVWAKTGGFCWYCKHATNPYDDFEVDHVFPVSKGGANRIDNLVPCCKSCNASKRDRILVP